MKFDEKVNVLRDKANEGEKALDTVIESLEAIANNGDELQRTIAGGSLSAITLLKNQRDAYAAALEGMEFPHVVAMSMLSEGEAYKIGKLASDRIKNMRETFDAF